MNIKDIIFENDDDADDVFAPSQRSLRSLNQATFQQRIPAMIRSAYAALDAQTGWFPVHLARDIGQCASQLYQDTEVYTLADQMIRQDIMPVIGNILHGLDAEAMQHQDNLGDAIADDVERIQSNSELGEHIAALHEQEHISPDEYYECYHAIERHISDLLIRVIHQAYVSTKITDVAEAFDNPYKTKTEKSEYGDVDVLAKLPDGSNLSIMFNQEYGDEGEEVTQVEFYRNNSQEVTGEGDAQRIFATVLDSIQKYIKKYKPQTLIFSASKEVDMDADYDDTRFNPESRAKLYNRLVQRYAGAWGYQSRHNDEGNVVRYRLTRTVAEGLSASREEFEGMTIEMIKNGWVLVINALDDWGNNVLGHVAFNIGDDNDLDPQELEVDERYQGQGIARVMYDYAKSKGYTIHRSYDQTPAGRGFWDKHRGEDVRVWEQGVAESSRLNEDAVMGKIEQSGQIVRILKKQHTVPFSSDKDWLLIDTDPAKGNKGLGIKWVPATTRFEWVRSYKDTLNQEVAESNVFTDARMNAIKAGQDTFVVHGKTYQVTGDTTDELEAGITENFIDGRNPQDKGDSKRHGIPKHTTLSQLDKIGHGSGRKAQLARWQANMRRGRAK